MRRSPSSSGINARLFAVIACAIAIILLIGTAVPVPTWPASVPAQVANPLRTIPNTDVNPYGGNFFLDWEVEPWKVEKTLQMAKEAGLGWANFHFVWEGLEPKKGQFFDDRTNKSTWDKLDFLVKTAEKYDLKIVARIDRPPAWTRVDNGRPERPPDNFADYGDLVAAVASRYKGRIGHYQIWNEPNIYPEWGNQDVDPAAYVRLVRLARDRIKAVDANAYVLSAPLAQNLETGPRNLNEIDFLDQMYQAGAADAFDILYANGYGFDAPPEDPADPRRLNFARVSLLRGVMERHNDAGKPIWLHEFGWNASPESMPLEKLTWRRVSEQRQAEYTVRAIKMARTEWPWSGVISIWYFRQDGHITPDQSEYYFRMVDPGFTPRMVYYAVAADAKGVAVAAAGAYQETNPALTVDSGWRPVQEPSASGGAWLVAEEPGASVTIKFVGTDLSLVTAKEPNGARLLVTVDGHAANLLPPAGEDRSFLDLASASTQLAMAIPIAGNLTYGEHVARLVLAPARTEPLEGKRAIIDGFQVGANGESAWQPYLAAAALIIVLVAVAIIWRHRRRAPGGTSA